ncbi:MAG: SagB/ThcOx family dehydrogenase [Thermodesulfobacteriota bacterium]|nr:SagB/ThcOx family dehydrogenase [Thermodesulfobacteriota bacterium]
MKREHQSSGSSLTRRESLTRLIGCFMALPLTTLFPLKGARAEAGDQYPQKEGAMPLPQPKEEATVSLERTITERRTIRSFTPQPLTLEQLSQLLWAAQGITGQGGRKRSAPSAGALYPMDLYALLGNGGVEGCREGLYHYLPARHEALLVHEGDLRKAVAKAALSQMWIAQAPLVLVITAEYNRVAVKYGKRGIRYAMIEAGHIGQNVFLQAGALDLGAGIVGAFDDNAITRVMKTPSSHEPLLIMPVGYKS